MQTLEKSVLSTLAYFDIFEYPLTLIEVKKWLWKNQEKNIALIKNILDPHPRLQVKNGLYSLRDHYQTRLNRYKIAEKKLKAVRKYLKILSWMPHVKCICLCNTSAYSNAPEESDIDLFVITTKNKIWTARFFTTTFTKIFNLRPTEKETKNKLCLSFFITEDNLNLEKIKIGQDDIYLTYWLDQLLPLYEIEDTFNKFKQANIWTKKYLPHAYGYDVALRRKISKKNIIKKLLELFPGEKFFKKIQLKILPDKLKNLANKDTRVIINDSMLKFHDQDKRKYYQDLWLKLMSSLAN